MKHGLSFALTTLSFPLLAILVTVTLTQKAFSQKLDPPESPRLISSIVKDHKAFLKNTKSNDAFVESSAMVNLCLLHWEAAADPRYEGSIKLRSIRVSVGKRLKKYADQLRKTNTASVLAKRDPFSLAGDAVAVQSSNLMNSLHGGPTKSYHYLGGNAAPWGYSEDLISLIEVTVSPDSWKRTGTGEATMEFYRPSLALVVTAPQQVQDRIQDLLKKLR